MGKVEDMRRQRELIYEQNQRAAAARAAAASAEEGKKAPKETKETKVAVKAEAPVSEEEGVAEEAAPKKAAGKSSRPAKAGRGGDEQGACSVCGKQRPLQAGMVSSHQKGFGKACPGSRKPPAGA